MQKGGRARAGTDRITQSESTHKKTISLGIHSHSSQSGPLAQRI